MEIFPIFILKLTLYCKHISKYHVQNFSLAWFLTESPPTKTSQVICKLCMFYIFFQTSERLEAGITEGLRGHTFNGMKGGLGWILGRISSQEG